MLKIIPTWLYIIVHKESTQYLGLDAKYIKIRQYNKYHKGIHSSVFTIVFPPNYNIDSLRKGEVIELKSEDFIWNDGGYFLPAFSFNNYRSYNINKYYTEKTNNGNNNHKENTKKFSTKNIIQEQSVSSLEQFSYITWDNILFRNGHILFASPYSKDGGKGKIISWKNSIPDFELIKPALKKKIPVIKVKVQKINITDIINIDEITQSIISLKNQPSHLIDVAIKKTPIKVINKPKRISVSEFYSLPDVKSSVFLKKLCNLHLKDFPIFYCVETRTNFSGSSSPEKAFVFCLKETSSNLIIIYENTIVSRSSYIFKIKKGGFIGTINKIHDFFSSSLENKREKLSISSIEFPTKVISYKRIIHNSIEQWINDIQKYCNYCI